MTCWWPSIRIRYRYMLGQARKWSTYVDILELFLLTKYQISDDLKKEDERLDDLDEQFRVDINWEQKKIWFDFIN